MIADWTIGADALDARMRRIIHSSRFCWRQYSRPPETTQAGRSGAARPGQNWPARDCGVEIPDFRYGWPYFGFADHVK
jgi:hypothetical protein